jgi:3-oxoadipate enol-lactonase
MSLHTRRAPDDEASGDATAGTVVFIHGFPFHGGMWEPQLEALPAGWRGLAPDLRGFGRSELGARPGVVSSGQKTGGRVALPDEPVLTMDRLADDVAELMEEEGAAPAVVCGLSMGGYVAFSLWRRHPGLIRALVLADTRAETDSDEAREGRMRMAQTARDSGTRPIASAMLPSILAERTMAERPEVTERVRAMIEGTAVETLIAALAGMAVRRDSTPDLGSIRVPTLVVAGEYDGLTPPDVGRAMAQRLADARFEIVPDAGHVSSLENPPAFNAALNGFLATLG